MEEVDNIIIDSLRNINCDIDDEIRNLKSFTPDNIAASIVSCLEIIMPGISLPKKMPSAMSTRLKFAMQLVEHVKLLGFHGDVGYQSILYSNEIEIRRVLMFLIERLPRESSKDAVTETIGYVPTLVKEIEEKVRLSLNASWVPPSLLEQGARPVGNTYLQHTYGNSVPLRSKHLEIPNSQNSTEELKDYWVHIVPEVTKQCNKNELIASLLYDNDFNIAEPKLKEYVQCRSQQLNIITPMADIQTVEAPVLKVNEDVQTSQTNEIESQTATIIKAIEEHKVTYKQLQEGVKNAQMNLSETKALKEKEDVELKEALSMLKIKSRTLTVLSKEENMDKLKSLVENGNERLLDLAHQWNDVQTPLIEQYRSLNATVSEQELLLQQKQKKLHANRQKLQQLEEELLAKEQLEKKLTEEYGKMMDNHSNNRSNYTKRIMEIIGNIKRQDTDIGKVLKDAKDLQKEIKTMSGQLDRSFTLSDALIFKDAKYDEVARKSYKFLAAVHMDCEALFQAVSDAGLIERESRNIQDQIDAETSKDTASKLKRILADIAELRKVGDLNSV